MAACSPQAPAPQIGVGKEARISRVRVAWLALDPDDNDPVRFLTYLIAGLQKFATTIGETALALLSSTGGLSGVPAPKTILTFLVNDLSLLANQDNLPHHP